MENDENDAMKEAFFGAAVPAAETRSSSLGKGVFALPHSKIALSYLSTSSVLSLQQQFPSLMYNKGFQVLLGRGYKEEKNDNFVPFLTHLTVCYYLQQRDGDTRRRTTGLRPSPTRERKTAPPQRRKTCRRHGRRPSVDRGKLAQWGIIALCKKIIVRFDDALHIIGKSQLSAS